MKKEVLDPEIPNLLSKYSESRAELVKYIASVDGLRSKVDGIFPATLNFRDKFVLEEKMKTMSAFFTTLLNLRQEYNKTIKDEIELRRRIEQEGNNETDESVIKSLAEQLHKEIKADQSKV